MAKKKSRGNGEGSIFQRTIRGKVVWVCEYTIGTKPDGTRDYITKYSNTRKEAKEKLEEIIVKYNTNTLVKKSNATMYSIGENFIEEEYLLNHFIDSTYIRKLGILEEINQHYIAQKPIQEITGKDVKNFYIFIANNFADSVIEKICGLSNTIFKLAIKHKIVTYNFFDDTLEYKRPKSSKETKKVIAFTVEDQKKFVDVIMNKEKNVLYKIQYLLSLYTGMRMGEINALYLSDINLDNNTISIQRTLTKDKDENTIMGKKTKTYAGTRIIYFNNDIKKILTDYINENFKNKEKDALLFPNNKLHKKYISTAQVNSAFKRLCQKYNISLGWNVNQHMLRHSFVTRCIEAGMSAKVLQKILGHTKIQTTLDTYCDVFDLFEKKHNDMTIEYLKEQNLMIFENNASQEDKLYKVLNLIKDMYKNQNSQFEELLQSLPISA